MEHSLCRGEWRTSEQWAKSCSLLHDLEGGTDLPVELFVGWLFSSNQGSRAGVLTQAKY